jgi:hypothetical protein
MSEIDLAIAAVEPLPPAGRYECERCHRVFAFENTLDEHWLRVHVRGDN